MKFSKVQGKVVEYSRSAFLGSCTFVMRMFDSCLGKITPGRKEENTTAAGGHQHELETYRNTEPIYSLGIDGSPVRDSMAEGHLGGPSAEEPRTIKSRPTTSYGPKRKID